MEGDIRSMIKFIASLLILLFIGCVIIGTASANTTTSVTINGIVKNHSITCDLNGKLKSKTPIALFDTKPKTGSPPLTIILKDKSTHTPTAWNWSFGDGMYSNKQNPEPHIYKKSGIYHITLKTSNCAGIDTGHQFVIVFPKWWWMMISSPK